MFYGLMLEGGRFVSPDDANGDRIVKGDITMLQDQDKMTTFFTDVVKLEISFPLQQLQRDVSEKMGKIIPNKCIYFFK